MKKILIFLSLVAVSVGGWYFFPRGGGRCAPLYDEPYIVVYGRAACGCTQSCISDLLGKGLKYSYKDVDTESVSRQLFSRMKKAGFDTSSFGLPVVDVNGKIMIRPDIDTISAIYAASPPRKSLAVSPKKAPAPQDPYAVSGIMIAEEPCAIVGGQVVKKGDKVGTCQILEIREDSVTFRDADGKEFVKEK